MSFCLKRIRAIHSRSRGTYGAPRIHAQLKADGVEVGGKQVARLMRQANLEGITRRRHQKTTRRDVEAESAPDLVEREFTTDAPDKLCVATSRISDARRVSLPGSCSGCIQPPSSRLGDGRASEDRVGVGGAGDGDWGAASPRGNPSLRPGDRSTRQLPVATGVEKRVFVHRWEQ